VSFHRSARIGVNRDGMDLSLLGAAIEWTSRRERRFVARQDMHHGPGAPVRRQQFMTQQY
jgi:hypothetical protein